MADKKTASVSLPEDYGSPENIDAQIRSIVERATNGEKLTTPQLLALQSALEGAEGIRDNKLREQAGQLLEDQSADLRNQRAGADTDRRASIETQRGVADAGYGADLATDKNLNIERARTNSADQMALDELLGNDTYVAGKDQAAADAYAAAAKNARSQDVGSLSGLAAGAKTANTADKAALDALLRDRTTADTADASTIGELSARDKAVKYVDPTKYGPDVTSTAAKARADAQAIDAQKDVLGEYEDLSNPAMTASERYMKELARQEEEQTQSAALGAAMRDLGARGIRSGGAEVGALLGSAQDTAQTRMLRDMAANKQAQERSEAARASRAGLAGDIRDASFGEQYQAGTAADSTAQFNKAQSQVAGRAADQLNAQQQKEGFERGVTVADAKTAATGDAYSRAQDVYKAGTDTSAAGYDRTKNQYDATADRTDAGFDRAGQTTDTQLDVDKSYADMADELAGKKLDTNTQQFDRGVDLTNAQKDTTANAVTNYTNVEKDSRDATSKAFDEAVSNFDATATAEGVKTGLAPNPIGGGIDTQIAYNELQGGKKKIDDDEGDFLTDMGFN